MGAYIVRRLVIGVVLLLLMSLVTFILFFASPVDPARFACGKNCGPELRNQARKALGYDDPTVVQWAKFLKGVAVGREYPDDPEMRKKAPDTIVHCPAPCLGYSRYNGVTVNHEIAQAAPVSMSLAVVAAALWLILGILFGIVAAVTKGSLLDRGIVGATLVVYAFPSFFIAAFLLNYVAIRWGLVPIPDYTKIADGGVLAWAQNLFLPAFSLALFFMAGYVRMTRAFVLESMGEDYMRTARAKGLRPRVMLFKHGLRAALTPLVTMVGLDFGAPAGWCDHHRVGLQLPRVGTAGRAGRTRPSTCRPWSASCCSPVRS